MDSLLKASAAAFVEFAGTNNWNWRDLISHVEHLKTFFYHITSDWSQCDISCFIFVDIVHFYNEKFRLFSSHAGFVAPGRFKTRDCITVYLCFYNYNEHDAY